MSSPSKITLDTLRNASYIPDILVETIDPYKFTDNYGTKQLGQYTFDEFYEQFRVYLFSDIYKTNMPDLSVCTCIFDTGGYNNDGDCGRPTIMIRHRNTDYETGYAVLQSIKEYLDDVQDGTEIFGYEIIGDINFLGTDEIGRYDWSINLIAYKEGI